MSKYDLKGMKIVYFFKTFRENIKTSDTPPRKISHNNKSCPPWQLLPTFT